MSKKWIVLLCLLLLCSWCSVACGSDPLPEDNFLPETDFTLSESVQAQSVYYVSEDGDNQNSGTEEQPFASLQTALAAVEKFKDQTEGDLVIELSGDILLRETAAITPDHNLGGDRTLIIRASEDGAMLTGGRKLENWQKVTVNGIEMYRALCTDLDAVRMFEVNDVYQELAARYAERNNLNQMNNTSSFAWEGSGQDAMKLTRLDVDLTDVRNPSQMEIGMICEWKTFLFKTDHIEGKDTVWLLQPYAEWLTSPSYVGNLDPGNHWFPNPTKQVWLQNDVAFIDQPGEWCFDKAEHMLYWYPQEGVDPNEAECWASDLDTLVTVKGGTDSLNRFSLVRNVRFENITFAHSGFDQIEAQGIGIVQGQEYYSGPTVTAGSSDPNQIQPTPSTHYEGAILVQRAQNVHFSACTFKFLSKGAVHLDVGTSDSSVTLSDFHDLGDSAVVVSNPRQVSGAVNDLVDNIEISNNRVRRTSRVNYTAPGIYAYYVSNCQILHNDLYDMRQCGISVGWGWYIMDLPFIGSNTVAYNRVGYAGNSTRDGGSIYCLGRSKDGKIYGNYVYDQRAPYGGIYLDEGSCNWEAYGNLVDNKWIPELDQALTWLTLNGFEGGPGGGTTVYLNKVYDNYYTNIAEDSIRGNSEDGYANVIENNTYLGQTGQNSFPEANPEWPEEAKAIFENSGIEAQYQGLFEGLE